MWLQILLNKKQARKYHSFTNLSPISWKKERNSRLYRDGKERYSAFVAVEGITQEVIDQLNYLGERTWKNQIHDCQRPSRVKLDDLFFSQWSVVYSNLTNDPEDAEAPQTIIELLQKFVSSRQSIISLFENFWISIFLAPTIIESFFFLSSSHYSSLFSLSLSSIPFLSFETCPSLSCRWGCLK